MAYNDVPAAGSKLQIMISNSYTDIPGCTDLTFDGFKRSVRNPTYLGSTAVAQKPAMTNYGTIKGKVWYDPNNTVQTTVRDRLALSAAAQNASLDSFRVVWADGLTNNANMTFTGFTVAFGFASGEAENGTWSADLEVAISTAPSFTAGS